MSFRTYIVAPKFKILNNKIVNIFRFIQISSFLSFCFNFFIIQILKSEPDVLATNPVLQPVALELSPQTWLARGGGMRLSKCSANCQIVSSSHRTKQKMSAAFFFGHFWRSWANLAKVGALGKKSEALSRKIKFRSDGTFILWDKKEKVFHIISHFLY